MLVRLLSNIADQIAIVKCHCVCVFMYIYIYIYIYLDFFFKITCFVVSVSYLFVQDRRGYPPDACK